MKQGDERYEPGLIPDTPAGLIQFLQDELPRISAALNKFPNGVGVAASYPAVPVTTTPTEYRLFEGALSNYDLPGGGWNSVTGEWTCAASGLYQVNLNAQVSPFGSGNKDYGADLRLYIDDVEIWNSTAVGDDAYPLACSISVSGRLQRESIIRATITLVHDSFTGTCAVDANMSISSTALE